MPIYKDNMNREHYLKAHSKSTPRQCGKTILAKDYIQYQSQLISTKNYFDGIRCAKLFKSLENLQYGVILDSVTLLSIR